MFDVSWQQAGKGTNGNLCAVSTKYKLRSCRLSERHFHWQSGCSGVVLDCFPKLPFYICSHKADSFVTHSFYCQVWLFFGGFFVSFFWPPTVFAPLQSNCTTHGWQHVYSCLVLSLYSLQHCYSGKHTGSHTKANKQNCCSLTQIQVCTLLLCTSGERGNTDDTYKRVGLNGEQRFKWFWEKPIRKIPNVSSTVNVI